MAVNGTTNSTMLGSFVRSFVRSVRRIMLTNMPRAGFFLRSCSSELQLPRPRPPLAPEYLVQLGYRLQQSIGDFVDDLYSAISTFSFGT